MNNLSKNHLFKKSKNVFTFSTKNPKSNLLKTFIGIFLLLAFSPTQAFLGFGEKEAKEISFSAVILSYGSISDNEAPSKSTPKDVFLKQIQELESKGFTVWRLSDIMRAIQRRAKMPSKLAAITFDGGYKSLIKNAFPILEQKNLPFTVFLSKDFADYKSILKNPLYMDMKDLALLWDSKLVEFGNASLGFESLAKKRENETNEAWEQRVSQSIDENGKWIAENFRATRLFAYPQGLVSADLEKIVKQKRLYGFTTTDGAASLYSPLTKIPRFDLRGLGRDMSSFKNKLMAVPFPLKAINYKDDDILSTNSRPMLTLDIYLGEYRIDRLRCFDDKGFAIEFSAEFVKAKPKTESAYRIKIRQKQDIQKNGSYNCVMPHKSQARLFWFSKKFF